MKKSQTGSTHVVIIIVLVVAVLGLLGFVFWQNFVNKPATVTAPASTSNTTQSDKSLAISEWGVKGSYSTLTQVGYSYNKDGDSISLTTSGLPDLCGGQNGVGTVTRYASDSVFPNGNGQTVASYYDQHTSKSQAHVGNYYYIYNGPSAPCDPDGGTTQTQLKTVTQQIAADLQAQ
jgi:cytoskeletal protein RodZ